MIIALVAVAALWIIAGLVIVASTVRPAQQAAFALADTTPVVHDQSVQLAA